MIRIITLPEDATLKARLQRKLEEYEGRLRPTVAPEMQMHEVLKLRVLEALLSRGEVVVAEFANEMLVRYGSGFLAGAFVQAVGIVNAYATGNTGMLTGGTGLPG